MNSTTFKKLLTTPLLKFTGVDGDHNRQIIQSANALFALIMDERENGLDEKVHSRILQHIRNSIVGGHEPCADCNHYWAYVIYACALVMAKNTKGIWSEFEEEEVERMNCIMKHFAISSNFIMNDKNNYSTGLCRRGRVQKGWNPNYRISLLGPIIAAGFYFGGADAVDDILINYDYEADIADMQTYGFENMLHIWTAPEKTVDTFTIPSTRSLLVEGGNAYIIDSASGHENVYDGGEGAGIKIPFLYNGKRVDDEEMARDLVNFCYGGGEVFSSKDLNEDGEPEVYVLNDKISPVEGKDGLMLEFNATDTKGFRSHAFYCELDFIMITALLVMLKEIGSYDLTTDVELYNKVVVGNSDLFFKLENGYAGYSLGRSTNSFASNINGYLYSKTLWEDYLQ